MNLGAAASLSIGIEDEIKIRNIKKIGGKNVYTLQRFLMISLSINIEGFVKN